MTTTPKPLIQLQDEASEAILALSENGKRAMGYGLTFMNKRGRGLAAIRRRYFKETMRLGFSEAQVRSSWGDVCDYASLCQFSQD